MAGVGSHVNYFKNFEDNIRLVLEQVKVGESTKDEKQHFDADRYWIHLRAIFKALSQEGTKLSIAFMNKGPLPRGKECEALTVRTEQILLELVSTFYSFPKSQGKTLQQILKQAVVQMVTSMLDLVSCLAHIYQRPERRQQATGIVWEGANNFNSLPQNNCDAVMMKLGESVGLVEDAVSEVDEIAGNHGQCEDMFGDMEVDDDDDDDADAPKTWTGKEEEMVAPVKGLIKTSAKVLKKATDCCKSNGSCEAEEHIAQLDALSELVEQMSPAVDNLIASLYAPVDQNKIKHNANVLFDITNCILNCLRHSHLTSDADSKWVDFLQNANTHNMTNLLHKVDSLEPDGLGEKVENLVLELKK